MHLTGQASTFGGTPTHWNDLWHTPRYHLGFWDLIGSEALQPMLGGPAATNVNVAQTYTARMRPCYPWTDTVQYEFNWGDGTFQNLVSGARTTPSGVGHAWTTSGVKTVGLLAMSDAHRRSFGKTTTRPVNVSSSPPTWTGWLNRDAPGGAGDFETRADYIPAVCSNPIAVQCQTFGGVDWSLTGEVYSCTLAGGVCLNANQPDGTCQDYRVRFLCP